MERDVNHLRLSLEIVLLPGIKLLIGSGDSETWPYKLQPPKPC